jgi:hypothetical protein
VDLAVAAAVLALDPRLTLAGGIAGAVAAATIEFLPLPLDDNVRVTLGGGAAAWGAALAASALAG